MIIWEKSNSGRTHSLVLSEIVSIFIAWNPEMAAKSYRSYAIYVMGKKLKHRCIDLKKAKEYAIGYTQTKLTEALKELEIIAPVEDEDIT